VARTPATPAHFTSGGVARRAASRSRRRRLLGDAKTSTDLDLSQLSTAKAGGATVNFGGISAT
jgi:hypothetical protein